jgi:hypothetical protein
MNRRRLLKAATAVGAAAGLGALGRYALIAPPRSERSTASTNRRSDLRGVAAGGQIAGVRRLRSPSAAMSTGARDGRRQRQRSLVRFSNAARSRPLALWSLEVGRSRLPNQDATRWAGVNLMQMLVCGDPHRAVSSRAVGVPNLRLGGASPGRRVRWAAVYGDQRGNEVAGAGMCIATRWRRRIG